ncbi:MAG: glutathione S-transferase family protein [Sandaracinaceae bacterium]
MTYVIYGAPGSGSGIVEAACAELGVGYEIRDLDARNDEHRGDAYAAINPQRKMPAVEAGGEVWTESLAILLTLDERHRGGGLLPPPGTTERAQALRWMTFIAAELYPLVEILDYPGRFAPEETAAVVRERAEAMWRRRWRVLEGELSASPYALPTGFSALDLMVAVVSRWVDAEWRGANLPKVEALVAAVRERPALAPVWARHFR